MRFTLFSSDSPPVVAHGGSDDEGVATALDEGQHVVTG